MSRVEKNASLEERLDDVKGEMVREVRRRTRVSRPFLTCSLLLLAVLVGLGVWIAWSVAATGLVRVPVFTSLANEAPAPTREVTPGVPVETVLNEAFTSTLTRRLYEGGGELTNRSVEVAVSEASLTASLRTFLEGDELEWIDASHSQIVVEPGVGIELFVPLSLESQQPGTAATIVFELSAMEGNLVVTPISVRVGKAKIPDLVIAVFLRPLLEAELAKLNAAMVGYAQISSIETLPRELLIKGELSVEIR
ncbi:hypothetical protein HY630_03140 [Candidatus Uhrbacteria bacterium]|nr:hypothetical protein [Candidatus Uhrbacteria bacterium]